MPSPRSFVIAGAGMAGAKAAETLREEGYDGRLVLVGDEHEPPYERPPLSKDYLRGESPREQARVHPDGFYAEHAIELRTGTTVEHVDAQAREIRLASGERLPYERLLLATGAAARRLDVPGAELDGVHHLRELADADTLAAALRAASRAVVVGGGWIGAEVAASARQLGVEVALVVRGEAPFARTLGRELGEFFAGVHREHGVELIGGATVARIEGAGRVERVALADGRTLDCDVVVAGIGAIPRVGLAERAGLAVEDGILADAKLETSAAGVFAAGDVAAAWHPLYDRRLRVEHWANALEQGPLAARAMLGRPVAQHALPFFFSDQYDIGLEVRGDPAGEVVLRGDPGGGEFLAFWLADGRVGAGMNVNVWDAGDAIEALIRSGKPVDRDALRDPDVALERLAGEPAGNGGG